MCRPRPHRRFKSHPGGNPETPSGLLPKPLDTALSQVWGYASTEARHISEGREINRVEAELLVGLAASVGTYLSRKPTP